MFCLLSILNVVLCSEVTPCR